MNLSVFSIEFNLYGIEQWLANQVEIPPEKKWRDQPEVAKYIITLLPFNPLVFHHKQANEYSSNLDGCDAENPRLSTYSIESLEWKWHSDHFLFYANETLILAAPVKEAVQLVKAGKTEMATSSLKKELEGIVIDSGAEESNCSKVHRAVFGDSLKYSNALASISVSLCRPSDTVYY